MIKEVRVFVNPFEEVVPFLSEKLMGIKMEKKQEGKESELMDLLIAREWKSLFNIPDVKVA